MRVTGVLLASAAEQFGRAPAEAGQPLPPDANRWLAQAIGDLRKILRLARLQQLHAPGRLQQSLAEHLAVFDALKRRADFQGGEVQRHEDHALAVQLRLREALQPFDMGQARQARLGPPPAHGHFKEGDTSRGEVFLEQALTFLGGFFREAQFQVSRGNAAAVTGHTVHAGTEQATNGQQRRVRQLGHQPQEAESQP